MEGFCLSLLRGKIDHSISILAFLKQNLNIYKIEKILGFLSYNT